jgi:tetratricopeptide (TPR) repeat protein
VSQNHYQVLGVAPSAAAADIKRAYRRLVVRYHPDKHGGDVRYEEEFKAVALAYRILGDPGRRATYDFQLAQAARRVEDARRQQQQRPVNQHVYGVPMPPPAPLRTRPPAGSRERHYQRIPQQRARFNARDWGLTLLFLLGIALFSLAVKVTMDRVSANRNYDDGLRAYANGNFAAAAQGRGIFGPEVQGFFHKSRSRGELERLFEHDPEAARADFRAALRQPQPRQVKAQVLYHLGRCETALGRPADADLDYSHALRLDTTLSAAYLARGKGRLLDLNNAALALNDLTTGLAQRRRAAAPTPWPYVQVRGLALTALGRYDEARTDYFNTLQANPKDGRTHFLLGRLAAHTGDSTAACEFYRRAVGLGYEYARAAEETCK